MNQAINNRSVLRPVCAFLLLSVVMLFASGCSVESPSEGGFIPNAEGSSFLMEATHAAQRVMSERRTATIQAATLSAGATREFVDLSTTGTAQALQVRQQEMNLNATANAVGLQQAGTRQAATETSAARRNEATGTAQSNNAAASETAMVRAVNRSGSRTAAAVEATGTAYAATSTRSAEDIAAALERHQATATAEALEIRRAQAQEDAARAQRWSDFFDTILKIILGLGSLALLVMLIVQLARYLDSLALRQRLVETRSGTVLIMVSKGQTSAQIIKPTPNLLDIGDEFETSQAPLIQQEAEDLLKVTTARGETFITKSDPEQEALEARRQLAMRLLRESMRYYAERSFDPREINRLPTYRDLSWSSETWVRAVSCLKPHIITRQGRGGGTFCGEQFPTLLQLYSAVGERRITLNGNASPSPTLAALSA